MPRLVAVGLVVLGSLAGARVARADSGMLPGGGTISWTRFSIQRDGSFSEPDVDDRRKFLNLAHCICSKANPTDPAYQLRYDLKLSAVNPTSLPGEVWVGNTCDNDTNRAMTCRQLTDKTIADLNTLVPSPGQLTLGFYDVVNGVNTGECLREEGSKPAWLLVKDNGSYVYYSQQNVGETGDTIKVDTKPPEAVTDLTAAGGENSIELKWKLSASNQKDYFYFQALCAKADDSPAIESPPDPQYQTAGDLCGVGGDVTLSATPVDLTGEDDVTSVPFGALEPEFLCGNQPASAAESLRIEGLENGTKYKVALLAIDYHGNVVGSYLSKTVTPRPVIDFWEDLNSRDSAVDGGCLLSTTYGDDNPLTRALREFRDDTLGRTGPGRWLTRAYYATLGALRVSALPARIAAGVALLPLVALALLWHLAGLPALLALLALVVWRRRLARLLARRRQLRAAAPGAAIAILLALLVAPRGAAADDFSPYWEDPGQEEQDLGAGEVKWHAGVRVGPYTPDIDLQFPQNAVTGMGPYQAMFGTYYVDKDGDGVAEEKHSRHVYQILPMLDVDRVVWRGFGELGVGGSLGYMQKTAYVYANGTSEDDPMRVRSTASENTFRLIPLAATLTYRLTYLDDRWGVPIIPYVRGGLAYYMWWIKGPSGDVAKTCKDPQATTCTSEDKAYGGTPGVEAAAGISIRAERIDAAAARSMRNSGILHAGFYGEVFWGRVDGFGSSSKLWVGDTTWFAGANFEF